MNADQGERDPIEVVRARRIEVVDGNGRVRAVVGDLAEDGGEGEGGGAGSFGLTVLDAEARRRLWLALEPTGPLLVFDQDGNVALQAGVNDPTPDGLHTGAHLFLASAEGVPRTGWWIEDSSVRHERG